MGIKTLTNTDINAIDNVILMAQSWLKDVSKISSTTGSSITKNFYTYLCKKKKEEEEKKPNQLNTWMRSEILSIETHSELSSVQTYCPCDTPLCAKLNPPLHSLPGKWWTPTTGSDGCPTTRTGSCGRTRVSSTWTTRWACGSLAQPSAQPLPMHNKVLKRTVSVGRWQQPSVWTLDRRGGKKKKQTSRRITSNVLT